MKVAISALSILNVAVGLGLMVLYTSESSPPMIVLVLSIALLVQGSYTLAFVSGALRSHHDIARHLQLGGSALALVAGTVGFLSGFLANIDPVNADPEYGPMAVSLLIVAHGLASLLAFIPWGTVKMPTLVSRG